MQHFIRALNLIPRRPLATAALALALALAGPRPAQAQTGPTIRLQPDDAKRGAHGPQHNFYFLPPGAEGEDSYKNAGFFGQKLRPYLGTNAEALSNLDTYRRQKTLFLVDRLVAVGSLGLYGSQVFAKSGEQQYFNGAQQAAAGLFVASLLATIAINRRTNEHLQRAVSAYNSGLPGTHGSWWRHLPPSTVGVRPAAQGQPLLALGWALR